jgi:hypothetical protein
MFAVTDDNIGWVLDEVITVSSRRYACLTLTFSVQGEHLIHVDHSCFGPTCGLLPVGVESTVLSTTGLRWNLSELLPIILCLVILILQIIASPLLTVLYLPPTISSQTNLLSG